VWSATEVPSVFDPSRVMFLFANNSDSMNTVFPAPWGPTTTTLRTSRAVDVVESFLPLALADMWFITFTSMWQVRGLSGLPQTYAVKAAVVCPGPVLFPLPVSRGVGQQQTSATHTAGQGSLKAW